MVFLNLVANGGVMATPSSLMAEAHGSPRYLTTDELDLFSADERFPARGWEYLVSRLEKRP
jgi:hypothetical protein